MDRLRRLAYDARRISILQLLGDPGKLIERILQVVDDLLGQKFWVGQAVAVFDAFVIDPKQIET